MQLRKNVMAVILNNKKILLVKQKKDNYWGFPKGGIKKNETEKEALERELFEELNLDDFSILKKSKIIFKYLTNKKLKKENQIYYLTTNKKKFIINNELADFKWVDKENLINEIDLQNQKELSKKLLLELMTFSQDH